MEYFIKCEICGRTFKSSIKGKEKQALALHIRWTHKEIKIQDYVEKFFYKGERPKCACGCGKYTNYSKFKFQKYFLDHKNKTSPTQEVLNKIKASKGKINTIEKRLERLCYSKEDFKLFFEKFMNKEVDFSDLNRETSLDKRTIKKYWKELGFINDLDKFERIIKINQIAARKRSEALKIKIDENILSDIYLFLQENPKKHTLREITNKFYLNVTPVVLEKRLKEEYGSGSLKNFLKSAGTSDAETEFYNVLKFYFGKSIRHHFTLENKIYDYILCEKVLIEFDGKYWHSSECAIKNDKEKDEIALKNNYHILRISEIDSKNPEILLKIFEIYEKIQSGKN